MSDIIDIPCPKCGNKTFRATAQPEGIDDLKGAVCTNCGYAITEDDIKAQAVDIATSRIQDMLKKFKD